MSPELYIATRAAGLSPAKQQALLRMRMRYRESGDVFSPSELAHLRFVRWLYQSGRLTS